MLRSITYAVTLGLLIAALIVLAQVAVDLSGVL